MSTRIMYSVETKYKAIEMKMNGYSTTEIQEALGIKNKTQVETWWSWYRKGEEYRFAQPVGKQYAFGKGPVGETPEETLKMHIKSLTQQVQLLKKYLEMERKWYQK